MTMATRNDLERFGVSDADLAEWEEQAASGIVPGKGSGDVAVGRPCKFGEPMRQVGFKEPESKIAAIERRAESLGMKRSDYLRWLVDEDLATAFS